VQSRFPGPQQVRALTVQALRERLSVARTFVMYGYSTKTRGEAMEAVELIRSELLRRGAVV
jgi:hypothetical protein